MANRLHQSTESHHHMTNRQQDTSAALPTIAAGTRHDLAAAHFLLQWCTIQVHEQGNPYGLSSMYADTAYGMLCQSAASEASCAAGPDLGGGRPGAQPGE